MFVFRGVCFVHKEVCDFFIFVAEQQGEGAFEVSTAANGDLCPFC